MFLIVAIITNEVSNTDRKEEKNHTKDVWLYFRTSLGIPSLLGISMREVYRNVLNTSGSFDGIEDEKEQIRMMQHHTEQ